MNNSDLFDRKACKKAALSQLKGNWKVPVLVALIYFLLFFCMNIGGFIDSARYSNFDYTKNGHSFYFDMNSAKPQFTFSDWIETAVSLLSILVSGIFEIAFAKFFLDLSNGIKPTFEIFFKSLELWAKGILELLWSSLFVFLWSLLFLVPGIIKAISYSQAFFILAEYPDVSVTQALKISQKITKGYKADLFVLQLSFIGWVILCFATCGIGFIWLLPYIKTTNANAYKFLMKNAFDKNRVSFEELHKTTFHSDMSENANGYSTYQSNFYTEQKTNTQNFWGNPNDAINNDDIKNESESKDTSEAKNEE